MRNIKWGIVLALVLFCLCGMAMADSFPFNETDITESFESFTIEELEQTQAILGEILNAKRIANAKMTIVGDAFVVSKGAQQKLITTIEGRVADKTTKYTWTSSDDSIATVNNGTVSGKAAGTATIMCEAVFAEDGAALKAEVIVTVVEPVKAITVIEKTIVVFPGNTCDVNGAVQVSPENASMPELSWACDNDSIATVTSEGILTAAAIGTCKLTATSVDGSKKTGTVNVVVCSFRTEQTEYEVTERTGLTITADYYGDDPNGVKITAKGAATATCAPENGKLKIYITPTKDGEATITLQDKSFAQNKYEFKVMVDKKASPVPVTYKLTELIEQRDDVILYPGDKISVDINKVKAVINYHDAYGEYIDHDSNAKAVTVKSMAVNGATVNAWKITDLKVDTFINTEYEFAIKPIFTEIVDNAFIFYMGGTYITNMGGNSLTKDVTILPARVIGEGSYSTSLIFNHGDANPYSIELYIYNKKELEGYKVQIDSILVDGKEIDFDASKIYDYGSSDKFELDLTNAIDSKALNFFKELTINFSVKREEASKE